MSKLTDVFCTYTGGGIYCVTAKFGDVYIASDLEFYGTYDVPHEDIEEKYGCDYDSHWKDPSEPLPTWQELLDAIILSYKTGHSKNMSCDEVTRIIKRFHPDLGKRLDDPGREDRENQARLEIVGDFMDVVIDYLEDNDIEHDHDDLCAYLDGKFTELLTANGVLKYLK